MLVIPVPLCIVGKLSVRTERKLLTTVYMQLTGCICRAQTRLSITKHSTVHNLQAGWRQVGARSRAGMSLAACPAYSVSAMLCSVSSFYISELQKLQSAVWLLPLSVILLGVTLLVSPVPRLSFAVSSMFSTASAMLCGSSQASSTK